MRRLDRYLIAEILGPLVLGFLVYSFLLLMQYLFDSAEMIIQRGLPAATVGKLLLLVLPSTVVLTIPMSLLFGILIAVGRLASDSELVAMRSGGVSLLSLYRPILLISAVFAAFNAYLMVDLLPRGNHALQQLQLEIVTQSVSQQIEPRVFHEEWTGKVLYVFDVPQGQSRWQGVFLAETLPGGEQRVVVADWGEPRVNEEGETLLLRLENATIHTVNPAAPGSYEVIAQDRLDIVLEDQFTTKQKASISTSRSVREMDLGELRARIADPQTSPEMRNLSRVQLQKNFAIPATCLVFGLLGLPLGFNNRRGGKASGFAISIGILLVYWILLSNGEEAARYGQLPAWVAMWAPNVFFATLGVFLLVRRNGDKSLLLSRIDRWVRRDLWAGLNLLRRLRRLRRWRRRRRRRRAIQALGGAVSSSTESTWGRRRRGDDESAATPAPPQVVLRLPRLRLRFPNVTDRYVARLFLKVLGLVTASAVTLYIVGDLGENLDDILENQIPRSVVLDYYKYLSLQILYTVSPIVILVTTLLTYSLLARTNEIIAYRALGVSLFRLSVPAVMVTMVVVGLNVYLQAEVLPASNEQVAQLKDKIRGRDTARTYRRADRQWVFGQGQHVYNYQRYDEEDRRLTHLQVFQFDDRHRLAQRLYANQATYVDDTGWVFDQGWVRSFDETVSTRYESFSEPRLSDYPETPEYFTSEIRPPEQLGYLDLKTYIEDLEARGQSLPELKVELHDKISFPVISFVMVLVALPFAFRLGRQGALYGIGLSVVLGIVFMAVYILFTTLGKAEALPPLLAVWSPNLIFGAVAAYLFLGVRT